MRRSTEAATTAAGSGTSTMGEGYASEQVARASVAEQLTTQAEAIDAELVAVQGSPVDIGGYYRPDADKTAAVMRPSATFNDILASLG